MREALEGSASLAGTFTEARRSASGGAASAGMVAKLRACEHALAGGVDDVVIVDGRDRAALEGAASSASPQRATRVVTAAHTV